MKHLHDSKRRLRQLVPSTAVLSLSPLFSVINGWTQGAACCVISKRRFPPMRYVSKVGTILPAYQSTIFFVK
jgi:hypothetical protein